MFQLLNEIGDAGDSRGTPASVPSSIGAVPVVANTEESGMLAESGIRGRELDEEGGGAGVLADSGNGRVSDGRLGVGARVRTRLGRRGCRILSGGRRVRDSQRIERRGTRTRMHIGELRNSSSTNAHQLVLCGCQQILYDQDSNRRSSSILSRRYCHVRLTRRDDNDWCYHSWLFASSTLRLSSPRVWFRFTATRNGASARGCRHD